MSSPNRNDDILELRNIHKSYDGLAVLRGVSLSAKPGTVTSIIGSSGSGKSTWLRCANLLETCQAGDIVFGGEPLRWCGDAEERRPADNAQVRALRQRIAMVFQQFNLWTHMTILDNVIEAPVTVLGKNRDQMREIGRSLLAKVGIEDKADAWPAYMNEAIFLFHSTTLVFFSGFPAWRQEGDALYYASYFAEKTFNPFVPYPIVAGYFILLTLVIIAVFTITGGYLNRSLPQERRVKPRFRLLMWR